MGRAAMSPATTPTRLRQLAITGLGHDQPTILGHNRPPPVKHVIETYARRMNIEQRLAEAIRSFGQDALAGAVPLNIDLDVVLSDLAHTICAALRRRLAGYPTTTRHPQAPVPVHQRAPAHQRRADHRSAQTPRLLTRAPPSRPTRTPVPWWRGRILHFEYD
jgi:hypothetical protein